MEKRRGPVLGAETGAEQGRDAEGKRRTCSLGRAAEDLNRAHKAVGWGRARVAEKCLRWPLPPGKRLISHNHICQHPHSSSQVQLYNSLFYCFLCVEAGFHGAQAGHELTKSWRMTLNF